MDTLCTLCLIAFVFWSFSGGAGNIGGQMGEVARAGPGCYRLELALKEISKDFRNQ